QGSPLVSHDLPAGSFKICIESDFREELLQDSHVVFGLLEVTLPVRPQCLVLSAAECHLVDLDSSELGLQRVIQKIADLFLFHRSSPGRPARLGLTGKVRFNSPAISVPEMQRHNSTYCTGGRQTRDLS